MTAGKITPETKKTAAMNQRASKKIIILLCALFLSRCAAGPDKKLNEAIEQYLSDNTGGLQVLEREFIKNVSVDSVEIPGVQTNGNVLYTLKGNRINILYPSRLTLSLLEGDEVKMAYLTGEYCAIAGNTQLSIFDAGGGHIIDNAIGDNVHPIRAIIILGDNVVYYRDKKLYTYNMVLKTSQQFIKDTFPPPYDKYFTVTLYKAGKLLGVNAGMAGSYNFSIIDLANEAVLVDNMSLSSSRIQMNGMYMYYITGKTGSWELVEYSLGQKKKKTIDSFNDLMDIGLAPEGYMYACKDGLYASEYGGKKTVIPFRYELAGTYRDMILLKYRDAWYVASMRKLLSSLNKVKERAPGLFKITDN
jgi:hypothetical protein